INFTRTAAIEYARYNIRVNCVCPAVIATPPVLARFGGHETTLAHIMVAPSRSPTEDMTAEERRQYKKRLEDAHPIGRLGTPEEVAKVVLFLASDEVPFVTGAAYLVDGGLTAHTGLPMTGEW